MMRTPGGKRAKSNSSASARCTASEGYSCSSRAARSRSTSMASTLPAAATSGAVSTPSPGPISTKWSLLCGATARRIFSSTRRSCRKCCAKRLRGRCECDGKLERLDQAARVGAPGAGDVERGAVVDRGAHERQTERHVHALTESGVFQHRQSLIVVHGEKTVGLLHKHGVRRQRAFGVDAARLGR